MDNDHWQKIEPSEVPADVQGIAQVLGMAAKAAGCTCDPAYHIPGFDAGRVAPLLVAHDDWCGFWTTGPEAMLHGGN